MKVGDLVKLSTSVTRRGLSYEDKVGIIITEIENISDSNQWGITDLSWVNVLVAGEVFCLRPRQLVVVDESR
jgi:hypothetical protein